jgi:alkyl sulfatase BDS1-like metallo-beta-lactamase superfamily hydrolase
VSLIAPTTLIEKAVETRRIGGIDIVFELTPGAEAPAGLIMYYAHFRVLNMAEISSQNMDNRLPVRGALVPDALVCSKRLGVRLNGDKAQGKTMVIHWRFIDSFPGMFPLIEPRPAN